MTWAELGDWWQAELDGDPAYEGVITPLLLEIFDPVPGHLYLDLGSGEGRVLRSFRRLGVSAVGLEINETMAARSGGPVVVAELPGVPFESGRFDGAYCVLAIGHFSDHRTFFGECARVVRPGGALAVVMNHPVWTAPGSTPISDDDGEVLWRPGDYFSEGSTEMPAGEGTVTFHHRTISELLQAAADAGWSLGRIAERPHHELRDQAGIPRLLACRWKLR